MYGDDTGALAECKDCDTAKFIDCYASDKGKVCAAGLYFSEDKCYATCPNGKYNA